MFLRQHAFVQDPDHLDEPLPGLLAIEHDVAAVLHTAVTFSDMSTTAAQRGIIGQGAQNIPQLVDISLRLILTPLRHRVPGNGLQVCQG